MIFEIKYRKRAENAIEKESEDSHQYQCILSNFHRFLIVYKFKVSIN